MTMRALRSWRRALVAVAGLASAAYALGVFPVPSPGRVLFVKVANSRFDRYTEQPSVGTQVWMRMKYWRLVGYSPYFDSRLSWFPNAWVYKDLYAIYTDGALAAEHPEWILRDATGAKLYIPYACSGGTCTQYAGDVGDAGFRAHWIADARATLAAGYRGLYVDDVNLLMARVGDGTGRPVVPLDGRTGAPMTEADWRRYMAEFCEAIRAAFPTAEIVHNVIWYAPRDDPSVARELQSATLVNLERGVNDSGIRGGTGTYGFETFLSLVDWLHARDRNVIFDAGGKSDADREYGLAAYLLVSDGHDGIGNDPGGTPDDWWSGYDVILGAPSKARYSWQNVIRRDFERGIVLVNQPGAASRALELDATYLDLRGTERTRITLGAAEGAVLLRKREQP
jgi:hypothetical protein